MNAVTRITAALLAALQFLPAQDPAPADPVIRVSVDLIQMDVIVSDSSGKHVTNLQASEFELLEDGKPQRLTHFSFLPASPAAPRASSPNAPAPTSSESRLIAREQVQRAIVLLTDDLGLSMQSMPNVRKAIASFIDDRLVPGDLVSLMSASGGVGALQQFTTDKRQLHAALDRIHWFPGRSGISTFNAIRMDDSVTVQHSADLQTRRSQAAANVQGYFTQGTRASVWYAIQGLRQMPGRKALVIVSDGFRYSTSWDWVIEEANRAGVTIYTVDARGITSTFIQAQDQLVARTDGLDPSRGVATAAALRETEYAESQQSLAVLAKETGGKFYSKDNDLGALLASALDEMGDYYLLGYQPQRSDYGTKFHKIEVRVKRRGLRVHTRSGFHGSPDRDPEANTPSRDAQLKFALLSPFAGGIPAPLHVIYTAGERKAKGRHGALLRGQVVIDAKALEFSRRGGHHEAVIDAVAAVYRADGRMVATQDRSFVVSLTDSELKETLTAGLFYEAVLHLPASGPYQFRVALRDANSLKTGSANAFIQIPDFDRTRLTLSSVILDGAPARVFRPGADISFNCTAFGANSPVLQFEVRLNAGPQRVFTSPLLAMAAQDTTKPMSVAGHLHLPELLPPGDYTMDLVVQDGRSTEMQWIAFSVKPVSAVEATLP